MVVDLPLELEREIFEISARDSSLIARSLVYVSQRVKAWCASIYPYYNLKRAADAYLRVDPILYESVTLYDRKNAVQFLATAEAKPSRLAFVKTLCIHCNVGYWQARRVVALCTTLDNLVCWISEPRLRPFPGSQGLGGLSFMLSGLPYDAEEDPPDFTNAFYSQVTHLHFTDRWVSWVTWTGFHVLPKLTHLTFLYENICLSDDAKVVTALLDILSSCPSLTHCFLLYTRELSSVFDSIEDPRFVSIRFLQSGIGKGEDFTRKNSEMWSRASEHRPKRPVPRSPRFNP